jgi:hypothetical protein
VAFCFGRGSETAGEERKTMVFGQMERLPGQRAARPAGGPW